MRCADVKHHSADPSRSNVFEGTKKNVLSVRDEFRPFSELNTTCSQDEAAGMSGSLYSARSLNLHAPVLRSMDQHSIAF